MILTFVKFSDKKKIEMKTIKNETIINKKKNQKQNIKMKYKAENKMKHVN